MRTPRSWILGLGAVAMAVGFAAAGRAAAADAEAYAKATAHDPHFEDKALWGRYDVERSRYAKQKWPKAPVMVWARTDEKRFQGNPLDPANWLIDGKPATHPPNKNVDVVFPDGKYTVRASDRGAIPGRHITVGSGVFLATQVNVHATGNVWFKRGSNAGGGSWSGTNNVFVRNDNTDYTSRGCLLANKIVINKAEDASVEFIGVGRTNDEFAVQSGTFIVGPDSQFCPGDRSMQYVFPGARLVLLSGARFHKRNNQYARTDLVVGGELLAGLPDRPLARDCTLGLSRKSKGSGDGRGQPGDVGLLIEPRGKLHVYSADPRKARLMITHHNLQDGSWNPEHDGVKQKIPPRTDVVLQGDLKLDGILFDQIRAGGVKMPDPSIMKDWAVFYGSHNDAAGEALYTKLTKPYTVRVDLGVGGTAREELKELRDSK